MDNSVLAVVVTYKRPEILLECLRNLIRQLPFGLRHIHVVVNSHDQETFNAVHEFSSSFGEIVSYEFRDNEGPAGGIYRGMKYFLNTSQHDFVWLMDDDVFVLEDCLREMLKCSKDHQYIYPKVKTANGQDFFSFGWSGVILSRDLVKKVGLPIKDLFYWAEDTEYLQNRITRVYKINYHICESATVSHMHIISERKPSWYYYYSIRNTLYYRSYIAGYTWYRFKRTVFLIPYLFYKVLFVEEKKLLKLRLLFLGIFHGLIGKIGKIVDPEYAK